MPKVAAPIVFEGDTNLYRSAAGALKTDGMLIASGLLSSQNNTANQIIVGASGSQPMITFSNLQDTNLYRSGANALKTDDTFDALDLVGSLARLGKGASLSVPGNDLNNAVDSGWYYYDASATNSPEPGQYGYVQVFNWAGVLNRWQVAYSHAGTGIWTRTGTGLWAKLWPTSAASPFSCVLGHTAQTTLSPSAWTTLAWNTERSDVGGAHAANDYYIYVPTAGNYQVNAYVRADGGGATWIRALQNGGHVFQKRGASQQAQLSFILVCAAGDSICIQVYNDAGSTTYYTDVDTQSPHFSVAKVG